jgi:hypothetical protein
MSLSQLKKNGTYSYNANVLVSSRRDDLEQLVYTLVFLAKGDLPWSLKRNYSTSDIIKAKQCRKVLDLAFANLPGKPHPLALCLLFHFIWAPI